MTRVILAVVLMLVLASPTSASGIREYQLTVITDAAGAGNGSLNVVLPGPATGARIPVGFANLSDVRIITGPIGAAATVEPEGLQTLINVVWLQAGERDVSLTLTFHVPSVVPAPVVMPGERPTLPKAHRVLRHAFINTQSGAISHYVARIVFPPGMRAHAIREALPKLRATEAGPRVRLASEAEGVAATLNVPDLKQGDAVSLQVELAPRSRSWGWLVVGVLLSGGYLVSFRDLVSRRAA